MRSRWVYRLSDGRWLRGGILFDGAYDPQTEGLVELDFAPDFERDRYDATGTNYCRVATEEEQSSLAAERLDREADADHAVAMIEFVLRRTLGRAPRPDERATARDQYRAIFRALKS